MIETVHPGFRKHHLSELGAVVHEFHGPEGGDPHDHERQITVIVVRGWYVVRNQHVEKGLLAKGWLQERVRGDKFVIDPDHIHQIVETAPEGCLTWCEYGPVVREALFYRNVDGKVQTRKGGEQWE